MIKINVDSSIREFNNSVNGFQVLKALGEDAPKGSIAMKIDGKAVDLSKEINKDCIIEFIDKFSPEGLEIIRHSTSHLMAYAVKQLFPDALIAIGPAIENGFYYDFDRETPFSENDFPAIEKKMNEIIKEDIKFSCEEINEIFIKEYLK